MVGRSSIINPYLVVPTERYILMKLYQGLYLQGDHTSVSYRNIVLTPVLTSIPSVDEWRKPQVLQAISLLRKCQAI